jgi:outer membrane protein TolC
MRSIVIPRRLRAPLFIVALSFGVQALALAQTGDADAPLNLDPATAVAAAPMRDDALFSADQLVREVLQRNQGIEAMRAAADAAGARIESAGALDDPMVSYAFAPRTAGGPNQGLNQNVQVSQKLPWPGTLDLRSKAAEAEAESADRQVADLRLQLAARARADYAQWYYVHRALAVNDENITLMKRLRAVAETAYASGQSPQQDVLQAEVELARLQNQSLELQRLQRTLQAKINALRNMGPDTAVPAPADLPAATPLPALASLRKTALARYPMLQSLDARLAATRDRVDLAHKNNYPHFNLMAGYNSLWDAPAKRLVVGVAVNIPFGGNHRGEVGEANARLREAEARLADARVQLLGDLEQAYATAKQDAASIALYRGRLLKLAKLNLQAAQADYSGGNGDFLKLITAEQQYLTIELELARARADFFTQLASLDYQTGGALLPQPAATTNQDSRP